jgi:hypothetical protein|tara:strand:- start:6758 stop:7135 length:378 start_codon:yes stop_codon:yes gene_type:complete
MKYIFLDESGDLGFSQRSSKYFIVSLFSCGVREEIEIRRIVKKIRRKILKKKLKNTPEIKWNNSSDKIRFKVLNEVANKSVEIFTVVIEKSKVYDYLRGKKHKLYNYLCNIIINECSLNDGRVGC